MPDSGPRHRVRGSRREHFYSPRAMSKVKEPRFRENRGEGLETVPGVTKNKSVRNYRPYSAKTWVAVHIPKILEKGFRFYELP